MNESIYKSYNKLPLFLNAKMVAQSLVFQFFKVF